MRCVLVLKRRRKGRRYVVMTDKGFRDMHTNRMRRVRGEARMPASPKKSEYQVDQACKRFLQRLGLEATHPFLFEHLAKIAEMDFNLKLDTGSLAPTDLCFIQEIKQPEYVDEKTYRRVKNSKGKYYYVEQGTENNKLPE